jgi:hypothetical protein
MFRLFFAIAGIAAISMAFVTPVNAHRNYCGSSWEICAARGKRSPVAVQPPIQPYSRPVCTVKKGCR